MGKEFRWKKKVFEHLLRLFAVFSSSFHSLSVCNNFPIELQLIGRYDEEFSAQKSIHEVLATTEKCH